MIQRWVLGHFYSHFQNTHGSLIHTLIQFKLVIILFKGFQDFSPFVYTHTLIHTHTHRSHCVYCSCQTSVHSFWIALVWLLSPDSVPWFIAFSLSSLSNSHNPLLPWRTQSDTTSPFSFPKLLAVVAYFQIFP
jgi:hypothetical protein